MLRATYEDLILRSIAKRCVSKDEATKAEILLIASSHFRLPDRGDDVADEAGDAVSGERPVRRRTEAGDHQVLRRDHDHILPDRALGEEGIARPALPDAVFGAKAVAEIGPEAGAVAD